MEPCFCCGTWDGTTTPPDRKNIKLMSSPYGNVCFPCMHKGLELLSQNVKYGKISEYFYQPQPDIREEEE